MKGKKMKIKKLRIEKLYNLYNYEIYFDDNLNILYGENGCGKTTILNIIASIISGKIYELFKYEFEKIYLQYFDDKKNKNSYINIVTLKRGILECNIDDEKFKIDYEKIKIDINTFRFIDGEQNEQEIQNYIFEKIPKLKQIYFKFNSMYLPINRVNNNYLINEFDDNYILRRNRIYQDDKYFLYRKDFNLLKVTEMIKNFCMDANAKMEKANKEFRNSLLKSLLSLEKVDMTNIITVLKEKNYLKVRKNKYLKILKDNELLDNNSEEKYNKLFDELNTKINYGNIDNSYNLEFLFTIAEVSKMDSIIKMADSLEKKQQTIFAPVEKFCNIVNLFLTKNGREKEISIINGNIVFKNLKSSKPIELEYLSSGEKQIIIFFAYLIFGIQSKQPAIVIVDEPELSLHLYWQKIFIDSVLQVNEGAQYIFATHSPEFVGRYRNYMKKLEVI